MGKLRPLAYADLGAVADLLEEAFRPVLDVEGRGMLRYMRMLYRQRWVRGWIPRGHVPELRLVGWVWEEDGRVVGHAALHSRPATRAYILVNVVVDPAYRGRGIARQLVQQALAWAAKRQRPVWLEVEAENQPARHLYRKLGFTHVTSRDLWRIHGQGLNPPTYPLRPARLPARDVFQDWLRRLYPEALDWRFPIDLGLLLPGWWPALRRWWEGVQLTRRVGHELILSLASKGPSLAWVFPAPNPAIAAPVWQALGAWLATVVQPGSRYLMDLPAGLWSQPLQEMGFTLARRIEVWFWTPEAEANGQRLRVTKPRP